jgi:hypothetical protein
VPTATAELRAKMGEYFGDGIGDWQPTAFLLDNEWHEHRGVWTSPSRPVTDKEWDCLDFLVQEWDHAYSAGKQEIA